MLQKYRLKRREIAKAKVSFGWVEAHEECWGEGGESGRRLSRSFRPLSVLVEKNLSHNKKAMETRGYGLPASTSPDQPADALGSSHPSFAHLKRESPDGTNWVVSIGLPLHLPSRAHPRISSRGKKKFKNTKKLLPLRPQKNHLGRKACAVVRGRRFFSFKRDLTSNIIVRVSVPRSPHPLPRSFFWPASI